MLRRCQQQALLSVVVEIKGTEHVVEKRLVVVTPAYDVVSATRQDERICVARIFQIVSCPADVDVFTQELCLLL